MSRNTLLMSPSPPDKPDLGRLSGARVIVTGGAGFIGSRLVDRLLELGADVLALDNFDPFYPRTVKQANLQLARSRHVTRFRLIEADLRDGAALERHLREFRPDLVAHLAAKAGVRPSLESPADYFDTNVVGTIRLLEALKHLDTLEESGRGPRLVFASSSSVYGDRRHDDPHQGFVETDPIDRPVSPYAASKASAELAVRAFHHARTLRLRQINPDAPPIPTIILRFFTAFGPRNRPDLALAKFARLIREGRPVPMFGDGSTERDYTYVDDLVDGVVRALVFEPSPQSSQEVEVFNLGHSEPVRLSTMIDTLAAALGRPARIERLPEQPGDVGRTRADIRRARSLLGWSPVTSFEEGVTHFVEWLKSLDA